MSPVADSICQQAARCIARGQYRVAQTLLQQIFRHRLALSPRQWSRIMFFIRELGKRAAA